MASRCCCSDRRSCDKTPTRHVRNTDKNRDLRAAMNGEEYSENTEWIYRARQDTICCGKGRQVLFSWPKIGPDWTGLDQIGPGWTRLDQAGLNFLWFFQQKETGLRHVTNRCASSQKIYENSTAYRRKIKVSGLSTSLAKKDRKQKGMRAFAKPELFFRHFCFQMKLRNDEEKLYTRGVWLCVFVGGASLVERYELNLLARTIFSLRIWSE